MSDRSAYKKWSDDEMQWQIALRLGWTELERRPSWGLSGIPQGATPLKGPEQYEAPEWPTDLNAAWRLLDGIQVKIEIENGPDGQMMISWWDRVWYSAFLENSARAICTAWLSWFDYRTAHPELFTEEYETYMRITRENARKESRS